MAEVRGARDDAPVIERHLGALTGRVMQRGGWVGGARGADAEPFGTGRRRPYDESTLRKGARQLAQGGGVEVIARAVEASAEQAVERSGEKAVAFTDMFDQVYWSKKPAHAAPIGNRGNRLLGATYFGMSFVQVKDGPALAYHVSWHKPASPLQDGLEAVYGAPRRAAWLKAHIRRHIWDRGGSGRPTLCWALGRGIPYLTVSKKSTHWTRFRRQPTLRTRRRVPIFVQRDAHVAKGAPRGSRPQEVIFPAQPKKGRGASRALRYQTGAPLAKPELRELDQVYKARWPANENAIKALLAVGFDRNLDRALTLTSSRGTDGRRARLAARQKELDAKIEAAAQTTTPSSTVAKHIRKRQPVLRQTRALAKERAAIAATPDKGARMPAGAELLCKNLILLIYNMLALLLMGSALAEVRTMSPWRVQQLLLSRPFLASTDTKGTLLLIDAVPSRSEGVLQQELVNLINRRALSLRGRALRLRIRDPAATTALLRF